MKNKRHYIVVENQNPNVFKSNLYLVVPEGHPEKQSMFYATKEEADECAKRWNSTYYISDYSEDEIKEFYDSIDFTKLETAINKKLKLDLEFSHKYYQSRGEYRVEFRSDKNLCEFQKAGLLSRMFKECYIQEFSNSLSVDKDTGDLYVWLTVDFCYQSFDSGHNGTELCQAYYHKGKWRIEFAEDRAKRVVY